MSSPVLVQETNRKIVASDAYYHLQSSHSSVVVATFTLTLSVPGAPHAGPPMVSGRVFRPSAFSSSAFDGRAPAPVPAASAFFSCDCGSSPVFAALLPDAGYCLSTCPRSRPGSMASRTLRFSSLVSGNPPSSLRSQRVRFCIVGEEDEEALGSRKNISTTKVPPVDGCRATSPRDVENVESSSCANWREWLARYW